MFPVRWSVMPGQHLGTYELFYDLLHDLRLRDPRGMPIGRHGARFLRAGAGNL